MPYLKLALDPDVSLFYHVTDTKIADSQTRRPLTILLLHGLGSSHCFYEGILPGILSSERPLRIIRIDIEGSGLSPLKEFAAKAIKEGSADGGQNISEIAQQAYELLDGIPSEAGHGLEDTLEVVVVGHSMSGMTACRMALRSPWESPVGGRTINVVGCVLLGPVVPSPQVSKTFEDRIALVRKEGMHPLVDTVPEKATGSNATALQRGFIRSLLCSQEPLGYISLCNCIAQAPKPAYDRLAGGPPFLIIAGSEDMSAPLEGCQLIQREIGDNCELKVIEGMGHWHCIEAPDEVGSMIRDFINKLPA